MDKEEFEQAVRRALWAEMEPGFPHVRPLLAHYTSVEVFEKMLTENEVWLSNPLFMNDLEEMRFGMNTGARLFRDSASLRAACRTVEAHQLLVETFDRKFAEFEANHVIDTYVLSFSHHDANDQDGLLSMWRGYGAQGNGVAIVFNSALIQALPESPFIISKVKYGSRAQREEWVEGMINSLAAVVAMGDQSEHQLHIACSYWFNRLQLFALFTKHPGFKEEQEWRVVYFSDRDGLGLLRSMLGYAITLRGVEPKLKLKVTALQAPFQAYAGIEDLIERIILGPGVANLLSATAIAKMLTLKGKDALAHRLVVSGIPYRPPSR